MKFAFYTVDSSYCDYLRKYDPLVPYTMDKKSIRPFVGIVFTVNGFNYYAPLTSPKPKHMTMKNQIDFIKINNGEWGSINFNNMIPVPIECLHKVELRHYDNDTSNETMYKSLLANQLSWCTSNKDKVIKQAEKLYKMITLNKTRESLINRCCNFKIDEQNCLLYLKQKD